MTTEAAAKPFRLSEFVKDGHLAQALRVEIQDLEGKELQAAQDAIVEVSTSGITGTYEQLVDEYKRAIRRVLEPNRKVLKNAQVDRKVIKNPQLAALLDRELREVTQEELDRANKALKRIIDKAKAINVETRKDGTEERKIDHEPDEVCRRLGEHSTLNECGYFKSPEAWPEVFRAVVREAIAG